ncbi:MAG TPA: ATP-binding cassette domain-containing protein [Acidobacteriota bacterium]
MIEVENLTKFYGPTPAIQDVSFAVEKGEILGFLGPNGAGKTTTMRILTCFMPPTSGRAMVGGLDVQKDPLKVRRKIGYMPETVPLYTDLVVGDYLAFVSRVKDVPVRDRGRKIDEVVEQCGLKEVRGRLIGRLSKGFRQRVGLAQALLSDPEVLILDEPTVGLDPKQIIEIRNLIRGLAGSRTIILSTHILPEVGMTCQRVVIIHKGRVVAVDTPANLTTQLQHSVQVHLAAKGPAEAIASRLRAVPGVVGVRAESPVNGASSFVIEAEKGRDVRAELASAVVEGGFGLIELRPLALSLEDIFIELVTKEEV